MATITKVEMYLIDANDSYENPLDAIERMVERSEFIAQCIEVKTSKPFEFDDDSDINLENCTKGNCEYYFKN